MLFFITLLSVIKLIKVPCMINVWKISEVGLLQLLGDRNGPRHCGHSSLKQIHETAMIKTKITEKKQEEQVFIQNSYHLDVFLFPGGIFPRIAVVEYFFPSSLGHFSSESLPSQFIILQSSDK